MRCRIAVTNSQSGTSIREGKKSKRELKTKRELGKIAASKNSSNTRKGKYRKEATALDRKIDWAEGKRPRRRGKRSRKIVLGAPDRKDVSLKPMR